jgi:hypothetical protein
MSPTRRAADYIAHRHSQHRKRVLLAELVLARLDPAQPFDQVMEPGGLEGLELGVPRRLNLCHEHDMRGFAVRQRCIVADRLLMRL